MPPAHLRPRRPRNSDASTPPATPVPSAGIGAPAPIDDRRRRRGGVGLILAVVAIVVVGVFVGVQWFRPTPSPVFHRVLPTSITVAGTAFTLPWPTVGSADLMVEGVGTLGEYGSTASVPVASITKVMTAYVVLQDHPLTPGSSGAAIAVTPDMIAAYQTGLATEQSVVKVAAGESITELQALEGLLIASGNDMATMLAEWDAGRRPRSWSR